MCKKCCPMQEFAPFLWVVAAILWQNVVLFRLGNFAMVTSAPVACAIIYGHKAGHTRSEIKDNNGPKGQRASRSKS